MAKDKDCLKDAKELRIELSDDELAVSGGRISMGEVMARASQEGADGSEKGFLGALVEEIIEDIAGADNNKEGNSGGGVFKL